MAIGSGIEWTEATWNFLTGCTKISPGCKHCYAERLALRLHAIGQTKYANKFKLTIHEDSLDLPFKWKKSKLIFVNSMSDFFHKDVPLSTIQKAFKIMNEAYWHNFQVLTKRSERLLEFNNLLNWTNNIWMGVSIEDKDYLYRMDHLKQTGTKIKFLSLEPLLGPLPKLNLDGIDWVIVGGESGPGARPIRKEWVIDIRDQCLSADVPFFFKQWGGVRKKDSGRMLDGRTWNQMPCVNFIDNSESEIKESV